MAVLVLPDRGGTTAPVKDWPAREVNLAALAADATCAVLDGARSAAVVAALTGQDSRTLWREAAADWRVIARPLMPNQTSCA